MTELDAEAWGIATSYRDHRGDEQVVARATVDAVADLLGAEPGTEPAASAVRVVRVGDAGRWRGELHLEHGGSVLLDGGLPPDVPVGYHELETDSGTARFVVAPRRCHLPDGPRAWGWALQLYALRSSESCGIGDLADLRRFGAWTAAQGAGIVLVNPLHASLSTVQQPSPYFPSSRCFRNPIYLRVEGVDGTDLNGRRLIDREAVWARKRPVLEERFHAFGGSSTFDRFCDEGGALLERYAVFCVLTEDLGVPWQEWPSDCRRPDGPGVARVVAEHGDRVRFHKWLQWSLDEQLARAGREVPLMQDLAIGCDPAGADSWQWQDLFCLDARVGAPPDEFNLRGQDWGLPPFDPWRLRAAGYEPFVQTVRAVLRHTGAVHIDHVMGLFRLWWVPPGAEPREGTYVRYPWQDLLGILALESVRAAAVVVGEDLGTVDDWMRDELGDRNVLSYRLLWFEEDLPAQFPREALAAVNTHDLPTVAGLWSGSDQAEQRRVGLEPNEESTAAVRERLARWTGADRSTPVDEVVRRTYELLAQAPSRFTTATLDDALGVEERPNIPGTTTERPNWSLALPCSLEEIETDERVATVAAALRHGGRS